MLCDLIETTSKSNSRQNEITLSRTRGKPLRLAINPRPKREIQQISTDDVIKIKTITSLSSNIILKVASGFRTAAKSRKLFEPGLKEQLTEKTQALDSYFDVKESSFVQVLNKKQNDIKNPFIYCRDIEGFCELVKYTRGYEDFHLKFGIDGGGGFLKITLSVQKLEDDTQQPRRRQRYSDGVAANKMKDTGVKKLFLVGLAPDTQENFENVSTMWSFLKIHEFDGTVATDLKLANILIGIMSHSSNYPCTWCMAIKGELHTCGVYRTIGNCLENYENWKNAGGKKQSAKKFKNCINPPLFAGAASKEIIDFIPPPELHLLTGTVNKIYDHMYIQFEETSKKWAKMCNVQRNIAYGNVAFAGNACNTLLKKVDVLRSICDVGCLMYVECFQNFHNVVQSCFTRVLKADYEVQINKFRESYMHLNISVTPKVHSIFFHVAHFCSKNQKGLGFFSEQATESAHHDFGETWKKYKVSNEHPEYKNRLLKAVRDYNSHHM